MNKFNPDDIPPELRDLFSTAEDELLFVLSDVEPHEVSIVDRPAIKRKFLMLKQEDANEVVNITRRLVEANSQLEAALEILADSAQASGYNPAFPAPSEMSAQLKAHELVEDLGPTGASIAYISTASELITEVIDLVNNIPTGVRETDHLNEETEMNKYKSVQREDGIWVAKKDEVVTSAIESALLSEIAARVDSLSKNGISVEENLHFLEDIRTMMSNLIEAHSPKQVEKEEVVVEEVEKEDAQPDAELLDKGADPVFQMELTRALEALKEQAALALGDEKNLLDSINSLNTEV